VQEVVAPVPDERCVTPVISQSGRSPNFSAFSLNPSLGPTVSPAVSAVPSTGPTVTSLFTNVTTNLNTDVEGSDVPPAETPSFIPAHPTAPTLGDDVSSALTPSTNKTITPDVLSAEQASVVEPPEETLANTLELRVPKAVEDSAFHDVAMPMPPLKKPLVRLS
jgi:hypothetical protein